MERAAPRVACAVDEFGIEPQLRAVVALDVARRRLALRRRETADPRHDRGCIKSAERDLSSRLELAEEAVVGATGLQRRAQHQRWNAQCGRLTHSTARHGEVPADLFEQQRKGLIA